MKSKLRFPRHQRGMALISVLAVLVLLTLLVVAFVARTTSARASSASYHATANTRLLADMSVNLVQAQINEATTLGITGGTPTYTWGSQPGAIRVFDETGNLKSIYRLYSATPANAGTARVATSVAELNADLPTATSWTSNGAQWVDLNSFVQDSEGRYHFPILDPRDPAALPTDNPIDAMTQGSLWKPSGNNPALKGISVLANAGGNASNPAPMPVRWLYILKDGSIVSPDAPGTPSNILTFQNAVNSAGAADVPSIANPIVGRIGYWTDDESSKININTAAGDDVLRGTPPNNSASSSTFWDTPVFCSPADVFLANYQPSNGEIQRYPGHPGTVGLNTTLSTLAGLTTPLSYGDFFSLLPRYAGGGTMSATVASPKTGGNAATVPLTASRLYTSVGEMLFSVDRTRSKLVSDSTNETDASATVERSNFFLTAHSASSELNLFGQPRVSIWPSTTTHQTPIDNLLTFDATVPRTTAGKEIFYFQRTDPTSGSTDWKIPANVSLLNYLDTLTEGGAGATPVIPGFGTPFTTDKYPNTSSPPRMRQILSEVFDYVRTTNMIDPVLSAQTPAGSPSHAYGQNWGNPNTQIFSNYPGGGVQVVPSTISGGGLNNNWGTQGVGAFPVPIEVTIDFVALGLGAVPQNAPALPAAPIPGAQYQYPLLASDTNTTSNPPPAYSDAIYPYQPNPRVLATGIPADGTTAMQAFVYVAFLNPAQITSTLQPVFSYSISGLSNTPNPANPANQGSGFKVYPYNGSVRQPAIPLYFPGVVANTNGLPPTTNTQPDEQHLVVDDTNGFGFLNGYIGDWVFGYIPFSGETGDNNFMSSAALLAPQSTTWNVNETVTLATGHYGAGVRKFPFYSQIFALPGQRRGPVVVGNGNFGFSGGTITIKMYDAHLDNQTLANANLVSTYTVAFPPSGVTGTPSMWLPTYSASDSQIIGTLGNTESAYSNSIDRWHFEIENATNAQVYYETHISVNDTVQSVVLSTITQNSPVDWSDARDLALSSVPSSAFSPHPNYGSALNSTTLGIANQAHDLWVTAAQPFIGNEDTTHWGKLVKDAAYYSQAFSGTPLPTLNYCTWPVGVPPTLNGAFTKNGGPGDWDNGVGYHGDGPWVNMADEGALPTQISQNQPKFTAYYDSGNAAQKMTIPTTFSPNREMPSPVMFGSLPTGVDSTNPKPWQTLLFQPGSGASGTSGLPSHPGEKNQPSAGDPPDHLLLDLFWMPQAEPYPISQPFVTEGKINLNYEIQPFNYIVRDTAIRALMGSVEIAVMPYIEAVNYKNDNNQGGTPGVPAGNLSTDTGGRDASDSSRLPIDVDQTLGLNSDPTQTQNPGSPQSGASAWFVPGAGGGTTRFFRSPSELCEMFLVPQGYTWQEFSGTGAHSWYQSVGGDFALVGDNTRERPYADLYSRVTTKSNTYTVYYTVQSLKNAQPPVNATGTTPGQQIWDETRGSVTGEYRGSTTLERYLDPNEDLPDFLGHPGTASLEPYYKWRIVATRQFAP